MIFIIYLKPYLGDVQDKWLYWYTCVGVGVEITHCYNGIFKKNILLVQLG